MQFVKTLAAALAFATSTLAMAAQSPADQALHLRAVQDMMAAMQSEKLVRSIAGASRFPTEAQKTQAFAKLAKVQPADIHARLGRMVRQHVSLPTAQEMTRYYHSSYGQKVLQQTYNSGPSFGEPMAPKPTATESKDLKRPEFLKAKKEFDAAEQEIRHQAFKLMQAINRGN